MFLLRVTKLPFFIVYGGVERASDEAQAAAHENVGEVTDSKVPEFDARHSHDVAGDAEGGEGKSYQSHDQFTLLCNYLVNNVKVVGKPC